MTTATARALTRIADRAFPILVRVLTIAGAVTFVAATLALVRDLATFTH